MHFVGQCSIFLLQGAGRFSISTRAPKQQPITGRENYDKRTGIRQQTVVVTGSAGGIGWEILQQFVNRGARGVMSDIDEDLGRPRAEAMENV